MVTQLLHYLDIIIENMVQGNVTDVINLDFAKAFDTAPHQRLLAKLESYGIEGDTLKWTIAFLLLNRTQVDKAKNIRSSVKRQRARLFF